MTDKLLSNSKAIEYRQLLEDESRTSYVDLVPTDGLTCRLRVYLKNGNKVMLETVRDVEGWLAGAHIPYREDPAYPAWDSGPLAGYVPNPEFEANI